MKLGLMVLFMISLSMLDVIAIIYFTISNLYLLGSFPLNIYEFMDTRTGYAISDYGSFFETGTYFSISSIIVGLLCGLDAITNPIYKKKRIGKTLYNYHALTSFALIGIGIFPIQEVPQYPSRIFHWIFALSFVAIYPLTRLLVLRKFNKSLAKKLLFIFFGINILAALVSFGVEFKHIAYPEYLMWVALLISIIVSKTSMLKKQKA